MPAPAAPAPAKKLAIPSLSKLATPAEPAPMPAAPKADPPPTEPVPPNPPPAPPAPPVIDTQIVQGPGAPVKSDAQFKQERLANKGAKFHFEELQTQYDASKATLAETEAALEKLRLEHEEANKKFEEANKLAETRLKDIENLRNGYFESNRATFDPNKDAALQKSTTDLLETLRTKLPVRVTTKDGKSSRVFVDALLQQKGSQTGLANILDTYAAARTNGNEKMMNLAINTMGAWLGADVDMTGDEANWKLIPETDPLFTQLEQALEQAVPHHVARVNRFTEIQREGPALVKQQFEQRETALRDTLRSQVFIPAETAASRLKQDPNDPTALFSQIVSHVPELREMLDSKLALYANALAAVPDNLQLPGLATNDPAGIQAHQNAIAGVRATLSEVMKNAVWGAVAPGIVAALVAERDAAEQRAEAAAANTNPGGPGARAGKEGEPAAPKIDTQIVKG